MLIMNCLLCKTEQKKIKQNKHSKSKQSIVTVMVTKTLTTCEL